MRFAGCEGDEFEEGLGEVCEGWEEVGMLFVLACWEGGGCVVAGVVGVDENLEGFCEIERGVGISIPRGGSGGIVFALLGSEFQFGVLSFWHVERCARFVTTEIMIKRFHEI